MDLELNFAAPSTSRGPSRSNVGGGHWKERMKNQQVARREQRKQDKPAAAAITGVAATPTPKQKVQKSSANGKTASPAAPGKSGKGKSSASGDREIRGQRGAAPPVNGDVDSDDERLRRSSAPNGAGPDAGPAQAAGKRQVISSLFSNLPKRPQPAATEATKDTEGAATADDLSVLTPSNAPSLGDDFDQLSVKKELVAHLKGKMGLAHPTTIQKLAVPFLCDPSSTSIRKDALLQAQTGSGKTLAYLLPIVQDLLRLSDAYKTKTGKSLDRSVGTLAIVLVPTRELAAQIFEVATKLLSFSGVGPQTPAGAEESGAPTTSFNNHRWITPGLLTGGAHRQHEKARLRKGVPLLIATPGRLLDHLEATKAFRIAGEDIRRPADPTRRRKSDNPNLIGLGDAPDSDDEFAIEDQMHDASTGSALNGADNDAISSDEDFEGMASRSRSHRRPGEDRNKGSRKPAEDAMLALRWLVLDEADRLMDMGFEPQITSIVKLLETRLEKRKAALARASHANARGGVQGRLAGKSAGATQIPQVVERRTILCSATIEESVEKLAGIALKDPLLIKGDDAEAGKDGPPTVKPNGTADEASTTVATATKYAPPTQLSQFYSVVSPKLRFVALLALLRQILLSPNRGGKGKRQKILVFMSCTDAVDFHWQAMSGLQMGRDSDSEKKAASAASGDKKTLASKTMLLPSTPIYRLHGSLDLQTRLSSLKAFSSASDESAVLFCTSVAARGLDVQDVNCVVQYDLPTEGGVNEYIHRVGRTARAGAQGQAWAFLLPSETGWVEWAEAGMQKTDAKSMDAARMRLGERSVDDLLRAGFGGGDQREYETRATDVQMAFERWVAADAGNARLAKQAFSSHVRAYATHPSDEKQFFHVKNLHLGHMAKAFGLREAPAGIGGGGGAPKNKANSNAKSGKGDAADPAAGVGRKRKRDRVQNEKNAIVAAALAAAAEGGSDDERPKKPQIPRSGRALDGKGLHGPKASMRGDFNIAGAETIEAMLNNKRRKK